MTHSISCTYIGHSTTLIKFGTRTLLTDPQFGSRILTQKRLTALPFAPSDLPDLDAVILSHTHLDHLDIGSFKFISCQTPVILPEGASRAISRHLPNPVIELSRFASYELAEGIVVTATPAKHCAIWGVKAKANSYVIRKSSDGPSVYFCGDSAYGAHFAEIAGMGPIDVALLPIGSFKPRFATQCTHMDPKEALTAFADLKATHMVPIHHGTFRLSLEDPKEPASVLSKEIEGNHNLTGRVHILRPGENFDFSK